MAVILVVEDDVFIREVAEMMIRVCQGLIVLIAILSVIGVLLGSAPPPASHVGPLAPNSPSNPSTIR